MRVLRNRSPYSSKRPIRTTRYLRQTANTFSSQADDELENPVLAGFEWDKEESWTRLIVHCKKEGAPPPTKKNKKKAKEEGAEA